MSKTMQITASDGSFSGYLALPASLPAPGVVVLQEIFGVNYAMREICDGLAANGYCALCPDLFWRIEPGIDITDKTGEELKRAFGLFGLFDVDAGMTDIANSIAALRKRGACNGLVGTLGYCLGGKLAYLAATSTDTNGSVSYYGVGIDAHLDEARNIQTPLLMHIAGKDEFVPPSARKKIISHLKDNPLVEIYTYPQRDHAFARPGGAHFHEKDAALANGRSLSFLQRALK